MMGVSLLAGTIGISYSFAGAPTGPPTITGNILTIDGLASGSVTQADPALNAIWNPVSFHTHNVVDLTTGLNNGSFFMTFANGEMLSGDLFENDSMVIAAGAGPFTQTLTFTGGAGEFSGASGVVSGGGLIGPTGFTTSGSGTLTAPALVPEAGPMALVLGGLALIVLARRRLA